eukprot:TRINITY_DN21149_c0_g1_i1.p1 TRINITY_DN21149_c0_g1~~TRINITY_DN21149_c0_g1_i1.p1  ORF type:complete len:132 (-),score=21.36 TRINITY_DN21149_c0_g1_i1:203-598(-)
MVIFSKTIQNSSTLTPKLWFDMLEHDMSTNQNQIVDSSSRLKFLAPLLSGKQKVKTENEKWTPSGEPNQVDLETCSVPLMLDLALLEPEDPLSKVWSAFEWRAITLLYTYQLYTDVETIFEHVKKAYFHSR